MGSTRRRANQDEDPQEGDPGAVRGQRPRARRGGSPRARPNAGVNKRAPLRVVGTDPGTSSLDLLLLVDGTVAAQARLEPDRLKADPQALAALLESWKPIDLIAGPSGYGLPLVRAEQVGEPELDLMALVRPDDRGRDAGVIGFRSWIRAFLASGIPIVFLPGGIHLPTIPRHRKANAIDMGTPDKVAVAALALRIHAEGEDIPLSRATFAVVEIGSAFTAVLVVENGKLVDASAGTRGPVGLRSGGAWDGETAYWRSPLTKADLFRGGLADLGPVGLAALAESILKHVAGLRAATWFDTIYVSGAGLDLPGLDRPVFDALMELAPVTITRLPPLPGAWVKHAAQGAALLADGLAGGRHADLVKSLALRSASGTILDNILPRSP